MGIHKNVNSSHDKIIFYMAFYLGIVIDNVPDDFCVLCSPRRTKICFLFILDSSRKEHFYATRWLESSETRDF